MVSTRRQKQAIEDGHNPLTDKGVRKHVLKAIGFGEHLFVASISKIWQKEYRAVCPAPA